MSDSGHFLTNRPPQAGVKLAVRRHPEVTHTPDVCLCMCLYVEKTSMSQHVSLSENTVDHVILFILLPKKQQQACPPRTWMDDEHYRKQLAFSKQRRCHFVNTS